MQHKTYGEFLLDEVNKMAHVDLEHRDSIIDTVFHYLENQLGVVFCAILLPDTIRHDDGLHSRSSEGLRVERILNGHEGARRLLNQNGEYSGQVAMSYMENTRMWITTEQKNPLGEKNAKYVDHWMGAEGIPNYADKTFIKSTRSKTSIIIPMTGKGDRPIGVINYESHKYLAPTANFKDELTIISESISELIKLCDSVKLIHKHRINARKVVGDTDFSKFKSVNKVKLFVAFAGKCCDMTKSAIKSVLNRMHDEVEPIYWDQSQASGSITKRVIEEIHSCRKGLCYFSEKGESENQYFDNPNVLIEFGMLNALSETPIDIGANIVPIREKRSEKTYHLISRIHAYYIQIEMIIMNLEKMCSRKILSYE